MDTNSADRTKNGAVSDAADSWPLSAREAAAALGVSERTVRRAIARGELPAARQSGVYRPVVLPEDDEEEGKSKARQGNPSGECPSSLIRASAVSFAAQRRRQPKARPHRRLARRRPICQPARSANDPARSGPFIRQVRRIAMRRYTNPFFSGGCWRQRLPCGRLGSCG